MTEEQAKNIVKAIQHYEEDVSYDCALMRRSDYGEYIKASDVITLLTKNSRPDRLEEARNKLKERRDELDKKILKGGHSYDAEMRGETLGITFALSLLDETEKKT